MRQDLEGALPLSTRRGLEPDGRRLAPAPPVGARGLLRGARRRTSGRHRHDDDLRPLAGVDRDDDRASRRSAAGHRRGADDTSARSPRCSRRLVRQAGRHAGGTAALSSTRLRGGGVVRALAGCRHGDSFARSRARGADLTRLGASTRPRGVQRRPIGLARHARSRRAGRARGSRVRAARRRVCAGESGTNRNLSWADRQYRPRDSRSDCSTRC